MSKTPPYDAGFGVYLHWPFCASKCPYCDFNSHVRQNRIDEPRYAAAFAREIAHQAAMTPGRTVTSIFLGGGTPSLMKPETVGAILDAVAANWSVAKDVEVSLEANPTSVEAGRLRGYKAAGVNRVSLGVQAMNDRDLRALGRLHSAAEALEAVKLAAGIFERTSFDLIYARPHQTTAEWAAELETAIAHAAEHLSLYQLTIEPGTVFERLRDAGKLVTPDAETARRLYETTREVCEKHGLPAYEISNHARPGAECRHNLVYWRYGEYAGVGPGAHARLVTGTGRFALSTELSPEAWLARVEEEGHGVVEAERLAPETEGDEFLLMGLRLAEGIDPQRYTLLSGRRLDERRIADLLGERLVERTPDGRLRVTREGFPVLDAIVADLAA
jgi:putative oxygen-independent coproporphyrinogen III oxidase